MAYIEVKARQLRDEAEKKVNTGGIFKSFFGASNRENQAIDYYIRAGNLFKMAKNWLQAGIVFTDAGDLNNKNENFNEAAMNYVEAANCFKKCDVSRAIEYYLKAIKLFLEEGRFLTAAKYHQEVAEICEDRCDIASAVAHYEQAAEYFRQENGHTSANKCLQKVGEYLALGQNYAKAIKIFQEIACFELSTSLTKYHAKDYLFRSAICHLCYDPNIVPNVLLRYSKMYPPFKDSGEYRLIMCLLECIEEGDIDGFTNAIRIYNATSKLSMWHVNMLIRAKSQIIDDEDIK